MRSSFFRTVIYLQQLFFQNSYFFRAKLLPSSHFSTIGSSLGQLLIGKLPFSKHQEEQNFGKASFSDKSDILHYLLFRAATYSKDVTFYNSYFFRRAIFFTKYFFRRITISQLCFLSTAIQVDTRRRFNADTTLYDIVSTLKRRRVSTGILLGSNEVLVIK